MQCQWTIKISQMIDGELSHEEITKVRAHLASCIICHSAHKDFLELGENLKTYQQNINPVLQQQSLNKILATRAYLWQKKILLPAPALAAILCIVFLLGVFINMLNGSFLDPRKQNNQLSNNSKPFVEKDFSFYDRGKRATILVVKKSSLKLGEKTK
jgi:predicted anti-sigma-YlaC factor YlaD